MTEPIDDDQSLGEKAEAAFRQAAKKVIERARATGTPVIIWKDGRMVEASPDSFDFDTPQAPRTPSEND